MPRFALLLLFPALLGAQPPRIGLIEFYGLRKVSQDKIRRALGVKEGDLLPPSKGTVEEKIEKVPGVVRATLAGVCCVQSDAVLFVGIEEKGAPHFDFNDPPGGSDLLPDEMLDAYRAFSEALRDAVRAGRSREDIRAGHSLAEDAEVRKHQERFLVFAELHLPLIKKVLSGAADEEHRAAAAMVIGYARRKHDVIDDLQRAIRDPDDAVRNNAMRALTAITVLAARDPELDLRIAPTWLVEMLNSIVWTDRNKAVATLLNLTESRPQRVLDLIRERALSSLAEMARWKSLEYAIGPFTLLGRVAGLTESQIQEAWSVGNRETVIKQALKPPRK